MNVATYPGRNLFRRKGRTILTILAVAVAVLIFSVIRTVDNAFTVGAQDALQDRLATRHKNSITLQLPRTYINDVRNVPGVLKATWANWFGAKDPKERIPFFAGFAADPDSWFDVFDDMLVEPAAIAKWKETKNGAILGDILAKTFQVKPGDKLVITSDIYPGDWEFEVVGIYTPKARNVDRNSLVMRWDYLNDDPRNQLGKDQIGWVMSRISGDQNSAEVSRRIDKVFDERDDQTLTMSERAFQLSFMGGFMAILKAFFWVSLGILVIMTLILANTIAMSVRERTHEYGVLRAVGFSPRYVGFFILAESTLLALLGGILGVGLVQLLINMMIGPALETNMASMFPYFRTPAPIMAMAFGIAVVLGVVAGVLPARRASRLKVTDALRRLD